MIVRGDSAIINYHALFDQGLRPPYLSQIPHCDSIVVYSIATLYITGTVSNQVAFLETVGAKKLFIPLEASEKVPASRRRTLPCKMNQVKAC